METEKINWIDVLEIAIQLNEKFPEKPYEIGAFKSRELFAQQAKKLPLTRNRHLEVSNHIFETFLVKLSCFQFTTEDRCDPSGK